MKKIWIVGANGHIGRALSKLLDYRDYEIFKSDIEDVDITDEEEVRCYMNLQRPDVIINCAGYTDVNKCEENVEEAYRVNALGVRNLAQAAQLVDAEMIQISTDDVFDLKSDKPYNEFDFVHPVTVYGKSKYAGECFVKELLNRYVIIRSSWVYGTGKDYVDEVLSQVGNTKELIVPDHRYAVPTSAKELAKIIKMFIDSNHYGTYHAVCQGSCSRYEFAKEILKVAGKEGQMEIKPTEDDAMAKPSYSVLDNLMLRISGLEEPKEWKEALKEYIEETGGIE